jgi:hypothetical protein
MLSNHYYAITFRYTDETYRSISNFRESSNKIVINSPTRITKKIPRFIKKAENERPYRPKIFVFEMNNTQNMVMNIIRISMKQPKLKEYKIHYKNFYNHFSYFGREIVDRYDVFDTYHIFMFEYIDYILFKGKDHSKRASGFTLIPQKKIENSKEVILEFIKDIFTID